MRFGWVKTAALAGVIALAACQGGDAVDPEKASKEAAAFMEANAKAEGVVSLPSGLQYKILKSGPPGGDSPDGNDLVRVDYEGALVDGTVFDSSYEKGRPAVFTPEAVIAGWTEGLQRMKVGDEWFLYVPPELGYGEDGTGPVPPNAVLVFRVQLLDVARAAGAGEPVRG